MPQDSPAYPIQDAGQGNRAVHQRSVNPVNPGNPRDRSVPLAPIPEFIGKARALQRRLKYRCLDRIHEDGHPDTARFETEDYRAFHDYLTKSILSCRSSPKGAEDEVGHIENSEEAIEALMANLGPWSSLDQLCYLLELCNLSNLRDQKCVDLVTKLGFGRAFIEYWDHLDAYGDCNLDDQINNPQAYILANLVLDATQRFTELSPKLCGQLMKNRGVSSLLRFVQGDFFDVEALNLDDDELQWMSRRELLKKIFTILYNCIRNNPDGRKHFRKHQAYETLAPFLDCRFFILRAKALFILAYIVTEEENEKLNTTSLNIEFIVKILRRSLEDERDHYSAHYNLFAVEVAEAVEKVALNDGNKGTFVEAGVLPHLVTMMCEQYSLEERKGALKAVWMLSFAQENKDRILQQKDMIDKVKFCEEVDELSPTSRAILWNVGLLKPEKLTPKQEECQTEDDAGEDVVQDEDAEGAVQVKKAPKSVPRQSDGVKRPHVMISYQWDVQKEIIAVKKKLKKNGFNVWLDLEKMGGSTLEAMSAAVEESAVILICFSEKYKDSPSCRTEAEYAYKLRKPIVPLKMQKGYEANGWLGAMLGTRLWIEMRTMEQVTQNMNALFRELADRGRYPEDGGRSKGRVQEVLSDDSDDGSDDASSSSSVRSPIPPARDLPAAQDRERMRLPSDNIYSVVPQSPVPHPATLHGQSYMPYSFAPRDDGPVGPVGPPYASQRAPQCPMTPTLPAGPAGPPYATQRVLQWSEIDVMIWLFNSKYSHVQEGFDGYKGRDVVELKRIAAEAPSFFYSKLDKEFGFRSLLEMIGFKQMLDDII